MRPHIFKFHYSNKYQNFYSKCIKYWVGFTQYLFMNRFGTEKRYILAAGYLTEINRMILNSTAKPIGLQF